jgi:hypothetical protein
MVDRAPTDVYFMVALLCAATGLGVERYVSSQNPSGDPLIPPRQAGVRAAIPWLAAAAIWLIAGAMT